MTNTFIWIQLLEKDKITYESPLCSWIKEQVAGLLVVDFDNYSEKYLIEKAIDLLPAADKIIIEIDATENVDTGYVTRFINKLVRIKHDAVLVIQNGNNALIEKMIKTGRGKYIINASMSVQHTVINDFLRN